MTTDIDLPGFADPVRDAQATFRAVLAAMAAPGSVHELEDGLRAPAPLAPASAAMLLTLVDFDTPLWLDNAALPARDWAVFHTGAPLSQAPHARFALALGCPDFTQFPSGNDEAPEESCTLILQVRALGTGVAYRLQGPGLREATELRADGLPDDFAARWAANHALFPRGIDIILCAGNRIAALPRSVRLENG